jgi:cysteine-rich repeat protein
MIKLYGRIAIFTLGVAGAQACDDDQPPPCNDNGTCEDGEESCLDCALCGDGNKDPSEPCDDGNDENDDACVAPCQEARCGDGFPQTGVEFCDDGDDDNSDTPGLVDHCNADCSAIIPKIPSTCGDTVCDPQENNGLCPVDCPISIECGNMIVEAGEQCEPALDGADKCDMEDCSFAFCGDKQHNPDAGEECDDGNPDDSDGCIHGCKEARCGDGILRANSDEQCDDGNDVDTDDCSNLCKTVAHRTVFVTSAFFLGDLGGLDGADAECNTIATAVGLAGTYRAWLSDGVDGPATRFDTAFTGIYELNDKDRTKVAVGGWEKLTQDPLLHAIDIDENGQEYVTGVWTNTDQNGMPHNVNETCSEWSGVDSNASVGNSSAVDGKWTFEYDSQSCASGFSLYCFQDSE